MRTGALGPSVELPMGPRNAVLGGCAGRMRTVALGPSAGLWGHETLYWVCGPHADGSAGTFGGASKGAAKRCT
eukprot:7605072-Pyramimonas_sp.AAC.1